MKICKKTIIMISILFLLFCFLSGCGKDSNTISDSNIQLNKSNGTIYDDVSPNFIFTIYPTRLISEDGQKMINYSFEVVNNSEQDYKNFLATVVMNDQLDQYIAAGVAPLEYTGVDIAAKSKTNLAPNEGRGVALNFKQLLSDEQFMYEAGLNYKDVVSLAEDFQILVKWDGGEETHKFTQVVINELP